MNHAECSLRLITSVVAGRSRMETRPEEGLMTCGPPLGAGEGGARVDCDGRGNESLDHEQRGAWGGSRDMEILQPPPATSTEAYES